MNNGEKNSRLPIYTRLNENGRISSYTKLSNKDEKYKIYLVRKYNDSSDEAEELLREDEDREKWETAMKKNKIRKAVVGVFVISFVDVVNQRIIKMKRPQHLPMLGENLFLKNLINFLCRFCCAGRSEFGRRGTRRSQTARAWPRAAQHFFFILANKFSYFHIM